MINRFKIELTIKSLKLQDQSENEALPVRYDLDSRKLLGLVFDDVSTPLSKTNIQSMLHELSRGIQNVKQWLGQIASKEAAPPSAINNGGMALHSTIANETLTKKVQALLREEPALKRLIATDSENKRSPRKPTHG